MENQRQILLINGDISSWQQIFECLKQANLSAVIVDNSSDGLLEFRTHAPEMVIIDVDDHQGVSVVRAIRQSNAHVPIMALVSEDRLHWAMEQLKYQAWEFVSKPVHPTAFEIALHRMRIMARNVHLHHGPEPDAVSSDREMTVSEWVASERFITVRQIIDSISMIMGRLADEVQGGVRYFADMPYFVSIHDRNLKVLAINPAYRRYLGNKLYANSWEIYSGEHGHPQTCPVARTFHSIEVMTTPAVVTYRGGSKVPVMVHTSPIYNNDGEVELVVEVFAGTKDLDRLSNEIVTTQQRYEQLFNEVPCYIAAVDRNMRIAAVNRLFREEFGERLGIKFYKIFKHVSVPVGTCSISHTLEDGQAHQSEMVLISRKGKQFNMLTWTKPITTATGKLIQVLVIFIDITELRQAQEKLSSLGLMISTLSHNLKGILTGLDAGLYFIEHGFYRNQDARIEEGLDVSKLMVDRIRKLVHNVLYYTKERELQFSRTEVSEFVRQLAVAMDTRIRAANITFDCEIGVSMGYFEIDKALLQSALTNLLENAIEACIDDESKSVHKITFRVKADHDHVFFDIIDNGTGIEQEHIPHMFTLFYSTKGHKGTGLGLFITRQIIQNHGGHISLSSEKSQGTHFHIRIPRTRNRIDKMI